MRKLAEFKISRRRFLRVASFWAALELTREGVILLGEKAEQLLDPEDILTALNESSWDPVALAQAFVRANGPTLMAAYALGFQRFVQNWDVDDGIARIKQAAPIVKASYPLDHHRLDALPGGAGDHPARPDRRGGSSLRCDEIHGRQFTAATKDRCHHCRVRGYGQIADTTVFPQSVYSTWDVWLMEEEIVPYGQR